MKKKNQKTRLPPLPIPETYFLRKEGSLSRLWCHLVDICSITTEVCDFFCEGLTSELQPF